MRRSLIKKFVLPSPLVLHEWLFFWGCWKGIDKKDCSSLPTGLAPSSGWLEVFKFKGLKESTIGKYRLEGALKYGYRGGYGGSGGTGNVERGGGF